MDAALRQDVLKWLAHQVPESRLQHVLRVEQMAIDLATLHQLDADKAAQAGLMHDLAKYFKPQRLLDMVQQAGLPIDPVDEANPHLLHATAGAIVARNEFGIHDSEILEAIANHTLGKPGMNGLSCVVFLADSLEPGRGDNPELERLRQTSREDLVKAVWLTCDDSLRHLVKKHRLIHPRTVMTRNWFLHQVNQRQPSSSKDSEPRSSLASTS